jgi:hypothetical protein
VDESSVSTNSGFDRRVALDVAELAMSSVRNTKADAPRRLGDSVGDVCRFGAGHHCPAESEWRAMLRNSAMSLAVLACVLSIPVASADSSDPPSWKRPPEACPSPTAEAKSQLGGILGAGQATWCDSAPPSCSQHLRAVDLVRKPKLLRAVALSRDPARHVGSRTVRVEFEIGLLGKVLWVKGRGRASEVGEVVIDAVSKRLYAPTLVEGCPVFVAFEENVEFPEAGTT